MITTTISQQQQQQQQQQRHIHQPMGSLWAKEPNKSATTSSIPHHQDNNNNNNNKSSSRGGGGGGNGIINPTNNKNKNQLMLEYDPELDTIDIKQITWKQALDPVTGRTYYYDTVTRKTQWEKVKLTKQNNWKSNLRLSSLTT
jgi:WW domain